MKSSSSLMTQWSHNNFSKQFVLGLACTTLVAGGMASGLSEAVVAQASPGSNTMPGSHIDAVIMDAAKRAKLSPASVRILQTKEVSFSNPCMLHFGEYCQNRPYNPIAGYEVLAQVNNQTWRYNVDRPGTRVVLDPRVNVSLTTLPVVLQNRILADAAARSGLMTSSLQITQVSQRSFSNACVFNFGEMCPMIYQPVEGWEAVVRVGNQSWTYRIDQAGTQLAIDPRVTSNIARLPVSVERAVLQNATTWTNSPTVKLVSAKAQTWGNDCAFNFGRLCPANFKPLEGWVVQVNAGGVDWTYHTNKDGSQMVMDRRAVLPTKVADAIAREITKAGGSAVQPNALRFLEVKEQTKRVCFLFRCRNELSYLAIVSNGRQQWGYESDDQGRRVVPVSVAQVRQAKDDLVSQR
ncbi:MAG: hypothetical protein NW224_00505 [Leptolyngbyaceae cyanobacterium bins.302]|nr:hypothetical protein [Leptolyngbyaceae cyanobacterium bins.302]